MSWALSLLSYGALAGQLSLVEPDIPASEKARITSVAQLALRNRDITQAQYQSTLKFLDARPCVGIDRSLNKAMKAKLSGVLAKQAGVKKIELLESFRFNTWQILYLADGKSDEYFNFYAGDPLKSKSLGSWGGAATIFETSDIQTWAHDNIAGIPPELASCFAWHVTLDRS